MKCDDCKFQSGESASLDYPYPTRFCSMGHWSGDCDGPEPEIDPWKDCKDFKLWNGPQSTVLDRQKP